MLLSLHAEPKEMFLAAKRLPSAVRYQWGLQSEVKGAECTLHLCSKVLKRVVLAAEGKVARSTLRRWVTTRRETQGIDRAWVEAR